MNTATAQQAMPAPAEDKAAPWFHNRVVSGLQFLWALGLPGTPASELATLTASTWVHTLWQCGRAWVEELDSYHLYEAFTAVAARAERWPTPRAVLAEMKPRAVRPALPAPFTPAPPHIREKMRTLGRRATDKQQEKQP